MNMFGQYNAEHISNYAKQGNDENICVDFK